MQEHDTTEEEVTTLYSFKGYDRLILSRLKTKGIVAWNEFLERTRGFDLATGDEITHPELMMVRKEVDNFLLSAAREITNVSPGYEPRKYVRQALHDTTKGM